MSRPCRVDATSRWHPRTPPSERRDVSDAPWGSPARYGQVTFSHHSNRSAQNTHAPLPAFWQRQHVPVTITAGHTRPRPKTAQSTTSSQHSHHDVHQPEIPRPHSANTSSSGRKAVSTLSGMGACRDSRTPRHDERNHAHLQQRANVTSYERMVAAPLHDSLENRLFHRAQKELKHREDKESSQQPQRACGKSRESRPKTAPITRSSQSTALDFRKRPTTAKPKRPSPIELEEASAPPQDMPAASSSVPTPFVAEPAYMEPKAAGMPNIPLMDIEKIHSKDGTLRARMQMAAGIPDRADFPFGPAKGWAAKRQSHSLFSFNPIRHTVDKFVVKDGRLQQERTSYTDPVPHLNERKFNRVKGVVEYDDLTRLTAARWNPSYQERFQNNHRAFYKQTGTVISFVDTMLKQGYKPNAV